MQFMPAITLLSDKKILIIDDLQGMRSQLKASLSTLGFERLRVASNVRDAMARLTEVAYDIILCDYYLGDATSGQQFLQYVRTREIISPSAIFIMITAERSYEPVMRAAEWTPDDYLVKPFTAAQLEARIAQAHTAARAGITRTGWIALLNDHGAVTRLAVP